MVVLARLDWLRHQASAGIAMSVNFSHNAKTKKDKIRFLVTAASGQLGSVSMLTQSAIDIVASSVITRVVVDRSHRHSDGSSEVCFWLQRSLLHPPGLHSRGLKRLRERDGCIRSSPKVDGDNEVVAASYSPGRFEDSTRFKHSSSQARFRSPAEAQPQQTNMRRSKPKLTVHREVYNLQHDSDEDAEDSNGSQVDLSDEDGIDQNNVDLIMAQAECSRVEAVQALRSHGHDIVNAISQWFTATPDSVNDVGTQ